MIALSLAAALWIGLHLGVAGTTLRDSLVARLGDNGFRGVFSLASVASLALLVTSYNRADTSFLWTTPDWLRWMLALVMLPASVLFVASVASPNPTAVGGERALDGEPRGITRVTRHPMLWSFALWAAVHVLARGDTASLVFFGAFLATALAGMPSIDAKLARREPERWARIAAVTSIVPGAAIAAGRNRFVAGEIGWIIPVGGVLLWAALLFVHPLLFGVSPLPRG